MRAEKPTRWNSLRRLCIAVGVLAVVGGWLGYGCFGHFVIVVLFLGLLSVPASIWVLAWLIWRISGKPPVRTDDRAVALFGPVLLIVGLGTVASFYLGLVIGHPLREDAKEWVLEQGPAIDAYRDAHGVYPKALADVAEVSNAPRLVRNGFVAYMPFDNHYCFFMGDAIFEDEWMWSSASRKR